MERLEYVGLLRELIAQTLWLQNYTVLKPGQEPPKEELIYQVLLKYLAPVLKPGSFLTIERLCSDNPKLKDRPNVVLTYDSHPGCTPPAPVLCIMGSHMDVVPADPAQWDNPVCEHNPFKLSEAAPPDQDYLYGRGTTDCLGHLAVQAYFLKYLALHRVELKCKLVVIFISDEEQEEAHCGADWLMDNGKLEFLRGADVLWVDTCGNTVTCGDAGVLSWEITVKGAKVTKHSGFPMEIVNPTEVANDILIALQAHFYTNICPRDHDWETNHKYPCESSFKATSPRDPTEKDLARNQIPSTFTLQGDIRVLPKYDVTKVKTQLEDYFKVLKANPEIWQSIHKLRGASTDVSPVKIDEFPVIDFVCGESMAKGIICPEDDFYRVVRDALRDAGCTAPSIALLGTVPIVTDMVDKLAVKLQMVGFADQSVYHTANEFCLFSSMDKFFVMLGSLVQLESRKGPSPPVPPPSEPQVQQGKNTTYPTLMDQPSWKNFVIPDTGLSQIDRMHKLKLNDMFLRQQFGNFVGYQINRAIAPLTDEMIDCFSIPANNVGDPFKNGYLTLNTKHLEINVLNYFARLWGIQLRNPEDTIPNPESYWGYMLTMGSTEANMYGLYNARDYLSGVSLINAQRVLPKKSVPKQAPRPSLPFAITAAPPDTPHKPKKPRAPHDPFFTPVAFFSEDTHYSIVKCLRTMSIFSCMELGKLMHSKKKFRDAWRCPITADGNWPNNDTIPAAGGSRGPGTIQTDLLFKLVRFFCEKKYPPLIILNIGTTFKSGYDPVEEILPEIKKILVETGMETREMWPRGVKRETTRPEIRDGYWIHIDAALGGSYVPFLRQRGRKLPQFDFTLPMVHSISNSSHKFLGCAVPGGLFMTRTKYQITPPSDPQYIGSPDTTFAGSRTALTPLLVWNSLASTSHEELADRAVACVDLADYFTRRLQALELRNRSLNPPLPEQPGDLWIIHHPNALAVCFRAPHKDTIFKYSLSGETLEETEGDQKYNRNFNHVYVMPSVTQKLIDNLMDDLELHGFALDSETPVVVKSHHHSCLVSRRDL